MTAVANLDQGRAGFPGASPGRSSWMTGSDLLAETSAHAARVASWSDALAARVRARCSLAAAGVRHQVGAIEAAARSAPRAIRSALWNGAEQNGFAPVATLIARYPWLAWCFALPVLGNLLFGILMIGMVPVILTLFLVLLSLILVNQAAGEAMRDNGSL